MNIFENFIDVLNNKKNKDRATVVFLHGDLGAGKTTFTKNFFKYLNVDIDIQSPTFVILKRYDFNLFDFENFVHIDAYRLNGFNDLKKIKFEEYLNNKKNLIFIEWPSLVCDADLSADINIYFEYHGDDRNIKIK